LAGHYQTKRSRGKTKEQAQNLQEVNVLLEERQKKLTSNPTN
jgi:hypothetical protein